MDALHSISRRLFLKSAPVAAAAALPTVALAVPTDPELAEGPRPDGLTCMVIDGKTCLIDTSDYVIDHYAKAVVVRWDGQISIDHVANYDGHRFGGQRSGMRRVAVDPASRILERHEACIILGRLVEGVEP